MRIRSNLLFFILFALVSLLSMSSLAYGQTTKTGNVFGPSTTASPYGLDIQPLSVPAYDIPVLIVGSGVRQHTGFNGNITIEQRDFTNSESNWYPLSEHNTGIIAQGAKVRILSLKVLDSHERISLANNYSFQDILTAVNDWQNQFGRLVVITPNVYTVDGQHTLLEIRSVLKSESALIVGSGNENSDIDGFSNYDDLDSMRNVIICGGRTASFSVASPSNFGNRVAFAEGDHVQSTYPDGTWGPGTGCDIASPFFALELLKLMQDGMSASDACDCIKNNLGPMSNDKPAKGSLNPNATCAQNPPPPQCPTLIVTINASALSCNPGDTLNFSIKITSGLITRSEWWLQGQQISTQTTLSHTFNNAGSFNLTLKVFDGCGTPPTENTVTITVNDPPPPSNDQIVLFLPDIHTFAGIETFFSATYSDTNGVALDSCWLDYGDGQISTPAAELTFHHSWSTQSDVYHPKLYCKNRNGVEGTTSADAFVANNDYVTGAVKLRDDGTLLITGNSSDEALSPPPEITLFVEGDNMGPLRRKYRPRDGRIIYKIVIPASPRPDNVKLTSSHGGSVILAVPVY